jgi:hypothetical protein
MKVGIVALFLKSLIIRITKFMRTVATIVEGKARTAKLSVGSGINFLSGEAQNKNSYHDWAVWGSPLD